MLGSWVPHPYPEMIRYTCPDLLLLEGFANGLGPTPETGEKATPEYVIHHGHLFGNRYDCFELGEPGAFKYVKRALALRRQFKELLYQARFMDNVGLSASPGLQAKWFAAPGGPSEGALITIVNATKEEGGEVVLSGLPGDRDWHGVAYTLDRDPEPIEVTSDAEGVRVPAPREAMSAVRLMGPEPMGRTSVRR
jgi:hypothetical protein